MIDRGILTAVLLVVAFYLYKLLRVGKRESFLPDGPKTKPIVGNALDIPSRYSFLHFTELSRKYGPIFSLKVFSSTIVVLNDAQTVKHLLDTRAKATCDRPPQYINAEYIAGGKHVLLQSGANAALMKSEMYSKALSPAAAMSYKALQEAEATVLLSNLLRKPETMYHEMTRYSGSLSLMFTHGRRCASATEVDKNGFSLERLYHAIHDFNFFLEIGATPPLDFIPILKYLPEFINTWAPKARAVREEMKEIYINQLFNETCTRIAEGRGNNCWLETLLGDLDDPSFPFDRETVAWNGGVILEGAAEATAILLLNCIITFVLHPGPVQKAQVELDEYLSDRDRSPRLEDIDHLPYCKAVILEMMRYRPVAVLGAPHCAAEDIPYKGYVLPKGTILLQNQWAQLHDPDMYDEPDSFKPERYLRHKYGLKDGASEEGQRNTVIFGSGQRRCPGLSIAMASLNITIPKLLWAFNFDRVLDPVSGQPIEIKGLDFLPGFLSFPAPFDCSITPRSDAQRKIIEEEMYGASELLAKYDVN